MTCVLCANPIRAHERHCSVCNTDAGYPNVRAALKPAEADALDIRFSDAEFVCSASGRADVLNRFRASIKQSKAVACRSLSQVMKLVSSDNELYASFYGEVAAQARRPEETLIEADRLIADSILFPHYREEIRFAALSLNNQGVRNYGSCSVTLSDLAIQHRATVFEMNSVEFCRDRKLGAGTGLPSGYRAIWSDRDRLSAAKLHPRLQSTDTDITFARRLLCDGPIGSDPDFIEVHIYGPLQRRAIERITVHGAADPSDEALIIEIERRASEFGAEVKRFHGP